MPVHDWSRVEAGIFHDFHHAWIEEIKRALNAGVLPPDYYALTEQQAGGFGPDVLTLQARDDSDQPELVSAKVNGNLLVAPPQLPATAETDLEFYRRKQSAVVVRHVSGDRVVAMVEVVSPGNKGSRSALRSFVEKAAELLERRIHLLILDLHAPGSRDPQGSHGEIWDEIAGQPYSLSANQPLTLAAYESGLSIRAFVKHLAIGELLPEMPLFWERNGQVPVPLEATYGAAFQALPRRWRGVLEASAS